MDYIHIYQLKGEVYETFTRFPDFINQFISFCYATSPVN